MPIRKSIGFAVLSVCSCVVAYFLATTLAGSLRRPEAEPKPPPPPSYYEVAGLRVPANILDLGEVWETDAHLVTLPLTNVTSGEIRIADVLAGCACADVSPRAITVPPGKTAQVRLTIDLTKRAPWDQYVAVRPLQIDIKPRLVTGPIPKEAWVLKGSVRSRITTESDKLFFGDRPVSGAPTAPREIEARVHGSAAELKAAIVPASAGSASVQALGDGRFSVSVVPSASLPPGPFKFVVELSVAGGEGEPAKAVHRIPATGMMQQQVRAFPARVFLGPKSVGTTAETAVQLQSPPGSAWEVERIECDSLEVKVMPAADGYRVTMDVKREGDQSATVTFLVRKGKEGKAVPVTMTVSCFGRKAGGKP